MPTLIVASTSAGAGKTVLTATLAEHFATSDRKTTAAVGWDSPAASSLKALLADRAESEPLGGASSSPNEVAEKAKQVAVQGEILVIEGKSGDHAANLALAEETDGLVLLVAKPEDNDVLGSASSYGSRLAGVVINGVLRYRSHDVASKLVPELEQANINVIGWLPEDRRLLAPTLGQVAEHLSADVILNEEQSDRLIDNFMIGGMVLDWGPFYFGSQENVGVVVRGDRPDIQLAALQTDTVRALVLTKGARPVEYVIYEATQRGVPLVMTAGSTEETVAKLEDMQSRPDFDHPEKLAHMLELAAERLDLDALEAALSQPVTQ